MDPRSSLVTPAHPETMDDDTQTIPPLSDTNSTATTWLYGGEFFQHFAAAYEPVHLPLSVIICLFGIVANTLNVIVLTRRSMATPTNVLLTGLSAAQLFLLMNYLLLLTFNVCASSCLIPALHSYSAVTYKWINVNLSVAFHTTALIHTLVLSIFRFLAVQKPAYARTKLTIATARACVVSLYFVIPFLCAPTFFTSHVAKVTTIDGAAGSICSLENAYDLDYVTHTVLLEAAFWTFGIFFKLVPSLTISILSLYLIFSLRRYHKKKARLTGRGLAKQFEKHEYKPLFMPAVGLLLETKAAGNESPNAQGAHPDEIRSKEKNRRQSQLPHDQQSSPPSNMRLLVNSPSVHNNNNVKTVKISDSKQPKKKRTNVTEMLVAVALLCTSVELPHGAINLLTAIFGQTFGMEVYDNLGDFFEMLTLLYSSVNFVLYCIMSTEFQRTFKALFVDGFREAVVRKLSRPGSDGQAMLSVRVESGSGFVNICATPPVGDSQRCRDEQVHTPRRK